MTKSDDRRAAAREIVEMSQLGPLVLRTIITDMRRAGYDVMPVHLRLLALLADGACNLSELAEKQAVSLPTMSNSISVLVERGWVRRVQAAHDRRMVCLELTAAGRAVLTELGRRIEARLTDSLAPLSRRDYQTLLAGLAILRRVVVPIVSVEKQGCAESGRSVRHKEKK